MSATRKYPDDCARAVRLSGVDARKDPATRPGALARIGGQSARDQPRDAAEVRSDRFWSPLAFRSERSAAEAVREAHLLGCQMSPRTRDETPTPSTASRR